MYRPKLAIIGASYLQLPLVEKAREMGVEVHCFAWEKGAVCKEYSDYFYPISVLDKDEILRVCKGVNIDGITTIATDIAVPTISYIAEKLQLKSNSFNTARLSSNKGLMRSQFKDHNIAIPNFIEIKKFEKECIKDFSWPVIVKPVDRSGSRGVNKVDSVEYIEKAFNLAIEESLDGAALIEEYIDGQEVSVESISWKGKHYILAVTDKVTTGPPHFVELEHHQPSSLSEEILKKIVELTFKSLDSLGIEYGASHTEIKVNNDGVPYVIEVGARMGGDFIGSHLVPLSTGYDFLKGVIDIALNRFAPPSLTGNLYSGVYFLSKETENIRSYFFNDNCFDIKKEIINEVLTPVKNSNDRSGYLIYCSDHKPTLL